MNGTDPFDRIQRNRDELIALLDAILQRTAEQAHEIDKALLTLSSGALVLSMTLLGRLPKVAACLGLLFGSWACFGGCVVLVVIAMIRSQWATHKSAVETANNLERFSQMPPVEAALQRVTRPVGINRAVALLNLLAALSFIAGIGLLGWFATVNMLVEQHAKEIELAVAMILGLH
jgi:hypothetical protein